MRGFQGVHRVQHAERPPLFLLTTRLVFQRFLKRPFPDRQVKGRE